ncbi:MAG: hypothetical protein HYT07_00990 [Candidatus Levybacteria bacterium]|nr:hypothetical protein [Candidatus Levybacteria bacterium]
MFSKNNTIILLLDRSGFILFRDSLTNVLRFPFAPDIVANLDVVNKDQLTNLVISFIEKNKINPGIMVVLLSDATIYEKNISILPQKTQSSVNGMNHNFNHEEEIQQYLQNIPFEDILARVIKTEKNSMLVAANKDLISSIINPFIKKGFVVEYVVPSFLYGQNLNITNGLTSDIARAVLRKTELLKVANLLIGQEHINIPQDSQRNGKDIEEKPKSIRQFILIGVFIFLAIVLVVMLLTLK